MKNIIESSVMLMGAGRPFNPILFLESDVDQGIPPFALRLMTRKKIQLYFNYTEGEDQTVKQGHVSLQIPEGLDKQAMKDLILTTITQ